MMPPAAVLTQEAKGIVQGQHQLHKDRCVLMCGCKSVHLIKIPPSLSPFSLHRVMQGQRTTCSC